MAIFHNESAFEHKLHSLKSSMNDLIEVLSERAADLKDKSVELKDEAKEETRHAFAKIAAMIKKYPFAAVGIALGSGYLVASIVRSR